MFIVLGIVISVFFAGAAVTGWKLSTDRYKGPPNDHFDGKKFKNPGNVEAKTFADVIKWALTRQQGEWEENNKPSFGASPEKELPHGKIRITFINHSTMLIQAGSVNILTDPIWSDRASPVQWIGPKRMRPAGIRFEDLPPVHIVLISHNHYDHLDVKTVQALEKTHKPIFVSPLGVGAFLQKKGLSAVQELDWHESFSYNTDIEIISTPAIHFSGRGWLDRDGSLWCGFVIKNSSGNVFFAGDTGYGDIFEEIGRKYGPFAAAMIPIGAYKPRWFMSPIHVSPDEAVRVHLDLGVEKSVAMHFDLFALADEGMNDAPQDLNKAKKKMGIKEDAFIVLKEGDYIDIR